MNTVFPLKSFTVLIIMLKTLRNSQVKKCIADFPSGNSKWELPPSVGDPI